MSCFWRGLTGALPNQQIKTLLGVQKVNNIRQIVCALKKRAVKTVNVRWNGQPLTEKELEENLEHIRDYSVNTVANGYLCSVCDPFLLLVCELFKVNIHHKYLKTLIKYTIHDAENESGIFPSTLHIASNRGHFWFIKIVK